MRKRAKRAIIASQKARGFARLAQVPHGAKNACLIDNQTVHYYVYSEESR